MEYVEVFKMLLQNGATVSNAMWIIVAVVVLRFLAPLVREFFQGMGVMHKEIAKAAPELVNAVKTHGSESMMIMSNVQKDVGSLHAKFEDATKADAEHFAQLRDLRHDVRGHLQDHENRLTIVELKTKDLPPT